MENDINNINHQGNNELSPSNNSKVVIIKGIRLLITFLTIVVVFMNTILGFALPPEEDINSIIDKFHQSTIKLNKKLFDDAMLRNFLLISSSIMMDASFIISMSYFIAKSRSWKILITILFYFALRLITQFVYSIATPNDYLWIYPGFPSIIVSYVKSNAFLFNSQVGLIFICFLYFLRYKNYLMIGFSLVSLIIHSLLLIALRGAFSVDIISSIIIAHFSYLLVNEYISLIDNSKYIGFKIKKSIESEVNKPDNEEKSLLLNQSQV